MERMSDDAQRDARVRRLEDIQEIRDLVFRYRVELDRRDLAAYAALFATDGTWSGRTGSARTPAGIREMLEERLAPNPPAPGPTTTHVVTEPLIAVDGDRATGFCVWTLIGRSADDTPRILTLGHYDDEFVREDGEWKFASRVAAIDIPQQ
jgi:3-phenylpropionate/cinnamic acid dioxygenase small subunit